MPHDAERLERLDEALKNAGLDALVCSLPEDVLLLTGYFPVVGTSIAVFCRGCEVTLFAPRDEMDLAEDCYAHEIIPFEPGSLDKITNAVEAVREPVKLAIAKRRLSGAVVGYECGAAFQPASYVSMHLYGSAILDLFSASELRPASKLLARLKSVLTAIELDRLRRACRVAEAAYERGRCCLRAGLKETEAAAEFRAPLTTVGSGFEGVNRADGSVFCMSGTNSAKAYGAYARSRSREIEVADLVLTHCNSHADGYWTDITRTYCMNPVNVRETKMYQAVAEASAAGFDAVRPGVRAPDVDRAVRDVLTKHGFGAEFKHGTGHGVGFAAINHNARPRIHPKSDDRLEAGMVFNIEPGIYVEGFGGMRHCDMVTVTPGGAELLTPFHSRMEDLIR
jgi:Xaa-Pro dipeptidase